MASWPKFLKTKTAPSEREPKRTPISRLGLCSLLQRAEEKETIERHRFAKGKEKEQRRLGSWKREKGSKTEKEEREESTTE